MASGLNQDSSKRLTFPCIPRRCLRSSMTC